MFFKFFDRPPRNIFKVSAVSLILLRFFTLPVALVTDITEGRYAEIGRKMYATGNYVTPFFDDGVPFWGKPPLSFWASAFSFRLFGVNQFAAHLPHFLFVLLAVYLTHLFASREFDEETSWGASLVLASSPVFIFLMGGVMTDQALAFTVALAFVSFWKALFERSRFWGYLFFIALGLSMLAKGPVGVVTVALPTGVFALYKKKLGDVWRNLPWVMGTLLAFAIAAPWYVLAEMRTPGFLRYFFIGEHWERYLIPHWTGDLYGSGRGGFFGVIWLSFLTAFLPWPLYAAARLFKKDFREKIRAFSFLKDDRLFYLLAWAFMPLVFFTFSSNTILPYVLPSMPPAAVLAAYILLKSEKGMKKYVAFGGLCALVYVLYIGAGLSSGLAMKVLQTEKFVVQTYRKERPSPETPLIYVANKKAFSGLFYTDGAAVSADDISLSGIKDLLKKHPIIFLDMWKSVYDLKKIGESQEFKSEIVLSNRNAVLVRVEKNP